MDDSCGGRQAWKRLKISNFARTEDVIIRNVEDIRLILHSMSLLQEVSLRKRKEGAKDTLFKKVYLAGSCEAESLEGRSEWRNTCEEWFKKYTEGFVTINPVSYFDYSRNSHKSDAEVLRFFHRKVKESDVVLVNLKNIRRSVGTICELSWAYESDIPIIGFYDKESDVDVNQAFHAWTVNMCDRIEVGSDAMETALNYIRYYYEDIF